MCWPQLPSVIAAFFIIIMLWEHRDRYLPASRHQDLLLAVVRAQWETAGETEGKRTPTNSSAFSKRGAISRKLKSIEVELKVAPVHTMIFLLVVTAVLVLMTMRRREPPTSWKCFSPVWFDGQLSEPSSLSLSRSLGLQPFWAIFGWRLWFWSSRRKFMSLLSGLGLPLLLLLLPGPAPLVRHPPLCVPDGGAEDEVSHQSPADSLQTEI